jgi:hypothetical protein
MRVAKKISYHFLKNTGHVRLFVVRDDDEVVIFLLKYFNMGHSYTVDNYEDVRMVSIEEAREKYKAYKTSYGFTDVDNIISEEMVDYYCNGYLKTDEQY